MLIKFYERIHNKYSNLFKFLFFLRYLFGIFIISIGLFITIPKFFDHNKESKLISKYLKENFQLELINFKSINYVPLPTPSLEIFNAELNYKKEGTKLISERLKIFLNLKNIYDLNDFEGRKVVLFNTKTKLNFNRIVEIFKQINTTQTNLIFDNLNIEVTDNDYSVLNLKNIYISNLALDKIKGEIFNKQFDLSINENFNKIKFKLLETGIKSEINIKNKNEENYQGNLKTNILNSNLKSNFLVNKNIIELQKFIFRGKSLSFDGQFQIRLKPYFNFKSKINIKNIDKEKIFKIDLTKLIENKNIFYNFDSNNSVFYENKRFRSQIFENFKLDLKTSYGRIFFVKNYNFLNNNVNCSGNSNFINSSPKINFKCVILIKDLSKFLNNFSLKKNNRENVDIFFEGNLNLTNNKIFFNSISTNQGYKASEEDLKYFKDSFQRVFNSNHIFDVFKFEKIKEFILQIS